MHTITFDGVDGDTGVSMGVGGETGGILFASAAGTIPSIIVFIQVK